MSVSHSMRKPVRTIALETSVKAAGALTGQFNIGMLSVRCAQGRSVGIVTDCDIVLRRVSNAASNSVVALTMTQAGITFRGYQTIGQAAYLVPGTVNASVGCSG